jgi:hypothetical protein
LLGIILLCFILLIEKFKVTRRSLKRLARSVTGIGLGISFSAFLQETDPIIQVSGLFIAIIGFSVFRYIRRVKKREDKCLTCPDYQENSICYGLRLEADAMRLYSDYASDLLQKDLKEAFIEKLNFQQESKEGRN